MESAEGGGERRREPARSGLGVGLLMVAIAASVAACEHAAQRREPVTPQPVMFESAADRPGADVHAVGASARVEPQRLDRESLTVGDDAEPRGGHTDRFLWDQRADVPLDGGPDFDAGVALDAGLGPDAAPETRAEVYAPQDL